MNILGQYKGIALMKNDLTSSEAKKLGAYCTAKDISIIRVDSTTPCPDDYVPCGSVEWCELTLGEHIKPDYYPEWLSSHLHRKVWHEERWPLNITCFIKPASRYKRFTGFIHKAGSYKKKKRNETYWCSEIITFTNEWRYYVSNGEVLCGKWYDGDDINTPDAPELNINIPKDYCGALDFGTLEDNTLALIEAQHPFACGWYGVGIEDVDLYIRWITDGWDYMKKEI